MPTPRMPLTAAAAVNAEHNASPSIARVQRRLFHLIAGSTFPIALVFAPQTPLLYAAAALAGGSLLGEALRFRFAALNHRLTSVLQILMKEQEYGTLFGSTYMLAATVIVIGSMDQPVATLALFYLSIGDPVAALVGERLGRHKMFGKSLEGTTAFAAASLTVGSLLVATSLDTTYAVMAVGALAAAIAEVAPLPVDDNFKVPLIAGGVMALTSHFVG